MAAAPTGCLRAAVARAGCGRAARQPRRQPRALASAGTSEHRTRQYAHIHARSASSLARPVRAAAAPRPPYPARPLAAAAARHWRATHWRAAGGRDSPLDSPHSAYERCHPFTTAHSSGLHKAEQRSAWARDQLPRPSPAAAATAFPLVPGLCTAPLPPPHTSPDTRFACLQAARPHCPRCGALRPSSPFRRSRPAHTALPPAASASGVVWGGPLPRPRWRRTPVGLGTVRIPHVLIVPTGPGLPRSCCRATPKLCTLFERYQWQGRSHPRQVCGAWRPAPIGALAPLLSRHLPLATQPPYYYHSSRCYAPGSERRSAPAAASCAACQPKPATLHRAPGLPHMQHALDIELLSRYPLNTHVDESCRQPPALPCNPANASHPQPSDVGARSCGHGPTVQPRAGRKGQLLGRESQLCPAHPS